MEPRLPLADDLWNQIPPAARPALLDLLHASAQERDLLRQRVAALERQPLDQKMQETQKLEGLGVLAGGIAHDFNNLLTCILGNADLARMELGPRSSVDLYLEEIQKASLRAADLCKQLLAYAGKSQRILEPIHLDRLVEENSSLLRFAIGNHASLHFHLEPDLPAIQADSAQIRQVLMNLIVNASEATESRSGLIVISTGVVEADRQYLEGAWLGHDLPEGSYVFLEVSDNGCGMEQKTLSRIFDPFYTTKFVGRGLGLSAVLGIVRGHGGALRVYTEPGQGTAFKVLFPSTTARPSQPHSSLLRADPSWRGAGTVLIIDDEESVRALAARVLGNAGFRTVLAADGLEGLRCFEREFEAARLILLDLTMPRLSGEATYHELRRMNENVPVLLMSGYSEADLQLRFAGQGVAGFIQKPFRSVDLIARVREALEPTLAKSAR